MVQIEGASLGAYRIGAELGRGGMGAVYRAESLADGPAGPAGSVVAVKVFHAHLLESEDAIERFRREAEIGFRIRHPNVVRTYELGSAELEGQTLHFMAMEFVEGQTLHDLVVELGSVPEHLLFQIADQALDALATIHDRNIIHRDIKPENAVITPDHRVLLMDLGVARLQEHGYTLTHAGEFIGSVAYAAPEQFMQQDEVGPRSDLYSMGIVLYELATGSCPFDAAELGGLLGKKLQEEVAPPRTVLPDLDPFWNEVISTCTRREISERFASAAQLREILQKGEQSEWWRARTAREALPSAARALRRLRLERETPLVGREADLRALQEAFGGARAEGRVLLLGGSTGIGKSRLFYEFLEGLSSDQGPLVLAGRCVGSGGRSYQPFLEALQDLLEMETAAPEELRGRLEARLAELLPDTPGVVSHLAGFLLGEEQPGVQEGFPKDALLSSFANLLRRVSGNRPVILVIEDLHLAGPESLELFAHLARCLPGHPVLLCGLYSEDELEEASALQEMILRLGSQPGFVVQTLEPLPAPATEALVRAYVIHERSVRALAWPLQLRSDGNPLFVLETLGDLRQTGMLVEQEGGLELQGVVQDLPLPAGISELAALKLGRLDEEQRETLEAAAVLGFEFEASLLAAVLEEKRIKLLKRLASLERKHRILRSSGKDSFRFRSHQLFEAVYEGITPALRGEYHSLVADTIQEQLAEAGGEPDSATAYALLRHLRNAERTLEIEPHLEAALRHLAANYHASEAALFLERVANDFSIARPEKRFAIAMTLWSLYEYLGERDNQLRVLETGRRTAEEMGRPGPRGEVHSRLAVTHFHVGQFDKAGEEAEEGLRLAREAGSREWESNSLHTLGVVAYRRGSFRDAVALWNEALGIRRETGDRRGVASSLMALGEALPFVGEPARALECKHEALRTYREIGDRRGECGMLTNVGNSHADDGELKTAIRCYEEAVGISRELGDSLTEAFPLRNMGRVLHMLGRTEEARTALARALEIFREIGNRPGELSVLSVLGPNLAEVGETAEGLRHLTSACALAESLGAKGIHAYVESMLARFLAQSGRAGEAWNHFERGLALAEETRSPRRIFTALMMMGSAALESDDPGRAAGIFERALEQGGAAGLEEGGLTLCRCRLARALRVAGRDEEAAGQARRVATLLESGTPLTTEEGPEVHHTLRLFAADDETARHHIREARRLIERRAASIRNDSHREHFRTRTWPNAEVLEEARRLLAEED